MIEKILRVPAEDPAFRNTLIELLELYFESVEYPAQVGTRTSVIKCNFGNGAVIGIDIDVGTYSLLPEFKDVNGTTIGGQYIGSSWYPSKIYKCPNGIIIGYSAGGKGDVIGASTNFAPVMITKDNNGNTVVIWYSGTGYYNSDPTTTRLPFFAVNKNTLSSNMSTYAPNSSTIYPSTSITNICVCDVLSYCPHAYWYENKEENISSKTIEAVVMGDHTYISTPCFCLLDE